MNMACYDDEEDYDDAPCDVCDHMEAELTWEGRFECSCGHSWWATADEEKRYWESYERAHRPPSLRERLADWWGGFKQRIAAPFRSKAERALDDDIPF